MRLRRLEIKGFKSFGKETVIHFSEGVTGIVGPNGSGKSNVVDAIRWVLGEQRTSGLRLEKMGDVLFNGTSKKKSANAASVSIVFENNKGILPTEYSEVKITRMLYKSGMSEYKLNDVTCRLKDITNLLVDTGISSNSYAIIELGMIDDILQDKENARRRMFEQAAGISKFKKRKKETQLKLAATNADLERVDDLLFEIQGNLKDLEKQARKARRYLKLKETYKEASIQEAVLNLHTLKESHANLSTQIAEAQDRYHKVAAELRTKEASLETEKHANLAKSDALTGIQKKLNELLNAIRAYEHDIKLAEQEIGFAERKIAGADERQKRDTDQVSKLRTEVENQTVQLAEMTEKGSRQNELLEELRVLKEKQEREHKDRQHTHQSLIDRQLELDRQVFELEKQSALISNNVQNAHNQLKQLDDVDHDLIDKANAVKAQLSEKNGQYDAKRSYVDELELSIQKQAAVKAQLEAKLAKLQEDQSAVGRKLDARKNEYQLTKSMVDNLEGYPNSIKFLNKQKEWQKRAILFSEVLQVEDRHKQAIERYLEPYLNYYVVEDYQSAVQGVSLLKDAQKGRAHFFVLEGFDSTRNKKQGHDGLINAMDVVETGAPYVSMLSNILSNVYIAQNDLKSYEDYPGDITIIAADGHLIRTGSLVSGGSVGLFDGKKIGRKKNLDKLQKEIAKLETAYNQLVEYKIEVKNDLAHLEENRLEDIIELHRRELQEIDLDRARLNSQLEGLDASLRANKEMRNKLEDTIVSSSSQHDEIKENHVRFKRDREALSKEISGISDHLQFTTDSLSEASQAYNAQHVEFIKLQNTITALERELEYKTDRINGYEEDLKRGLEEKRAAEATITQNKDQIESWRSKVAQAYETKYSLESELSEKERAFFAARDAVYQLEKDISKLNQTHRQEQSLINELKDTFNEVKFKMQHVGQRVQVEFNISLDDLMKLDAPEEVELEALSDRVEKLRNRVFNFGEVNPLAVEAHSEMEDRHASIVEQRDDILDAQKSLEETIEELEQTATTKFLEAFNEVRDHFQEIFRTLFREGDDCDLILLNPEVPLESKVEIIAKPKGKRPVTLSQLSGGEKTLTATALLFALYLLKPAPFCVFDEVDAPLDDANIFKFNHIIRDFSGASQFVIITHNKLTMAEVDVIYGVYMDEPGISSVTPVDFRQFDHEPLPVEMVG